jgi:hypothetical protein
VKVVGGSEIYNFPIHHLVQFCYSTFGSFACSKQGPGARSWTGRHRAATSRAVPQPAPPSAPSRGRTVSRPRCPEARASRACAPTVPGAVPVARRACGAVPVVWTSQDPLLRWVPGPTTRWAPGTTRLALHDTCWREAQGLWWRSTRIGSSTCPALYRGLLDVLD